MSYENKLLYKDSMLMTLCHDTSEYIVLVYSFLFLYKNKLLRINEIDYVIKKYF